MKKRALCLLLALATVFSLTAPAFAEEAPIPAEEPVVAEEPVEAAEVVETEEEPVIEPEEVTEDVVDSGTCGNNVIWSLSTDGVLTISGSGQMKNYDLDTPWYGYANMSMISTITITNGVTSIGNSAFEDCTSLRSVTIPNSVTSIGYGAFSRCYGLTSLTIPDSVTHIGSDTFFDCSSLTSVTIGKGVTGIESGMFNRCVSLESVTIPDGVTYIDDFAFGECFSLTSVTISKSVAKIGFEAFSDCMSLKSVTILNPNCYMYPYDGATLGIPGTTTICGYVGSTAEKYAKEWGYSFKALDATPAPTAAPKLAAPTVKIEKVSDGIKVSWNKVTGAPRYMVYYKEGSGSWKKIGTTTATSYTRKAANLKNGTTYAFTVRCCANDKKTLLGGYKASNALKYSVNLAAPTVKIEKVSDGIKVSWNKIAGSPRYMVYYKEGNGSWKKIGTTTATSYTRAAKYLKNNVTYYFTVRCCQNDKKTLISSYKASNGLKYKK